MSLIIKILIGILILFLVFVAIKFLIGIALKLILGLISVVIVVSIIGSIVYFLFNYYPAILDFIWLSILYILATFISASLFLLMGMIIYKLIQRCKLRKFMVIAICLLIVSGIINDLFAPNSGNGIGLYFVCMCYLLAIVFNWSIYQETDDFFKNMNEWEDEAESHWAAFTITGVILSYILFYNHVLLDINNIYDFNFRAVVITTLWIYIFMLYTDISIIEIHKNTLELFKEKKYLSIDEAIQSIKKGHDIKLIRSVLKSMVYKNDIVLIKDKILPSTLINEIKSNTKELVQGNEIIEDFEFISASQENFLNDYDDLESLVGELYPNLMCAYNQSGSLQKFVDYELADHICDFCRCFTYDPIHKNGSIYCSEECSNMDYECECILADNKRNYAVKLGISVGIAESASLVSSNIMMGTPRGHGFSAEQANTLIDAFEGKSAQVIGGDNAKHGADRIVDGILIQSKYCKTGSKCISQCFENDKFIYMDNKGLPMKIEVPADENIYNSAVKAMEHRIRSGQVEGVTDINEAKNIVIKGSITYEQAKNIAKAGTIESLTYDTAQGIRVSSLSMGITFIASLATSMWKGEKFEDAIKNATYKSVQVAGTTLLSVVLTSQVTKTIAGKSIAMTSKTLVENVSRSVLPIEASTALATISKNTVLPVAITATIFTAGNFVRYLNGNLSAENLLKSAVKDTVSMAAGATGAALGARIGLIGGFAGAVVGGIIGSAFAEFLFGDDENKREQERQNRISSMYPIFEKHLTRLATEFMLSEQEFHNVLKYIKQYGAENLLLNMSSQGNRTSYVVCVLKPIIIAETIKRDFITLPDIKNIREATNQIIDAI